MILSNFHMLILIMALSSSCVFVILIFQPVNRIVWTAWFNAEAHQTACFWEPPNALCFMKIPNGDCGCCLWLLSLPTAFINSEGTDQKIPIHSHPLRDLIPWMFSEHIRKQWDWFKRQPVVYPFTQVQNWRRCGLRHNLCASSGMRATVQQWMSELFHSFLLEYSFLMDSWPV